MEYIYEVIEKAENPAETKVKKSGITAEFTLREVQADIASLQKLRLEIDAKARIESAKMQNIERDMPEIADMDENQRKIIYIYQQAASTYKMASEKVAEIDKQLEEYEAELNNITQQTGLVLTEPNGTTEEESGGTDGSGSGESEGN